MSLIDMVRSAELGAGYSTEGIIRKKAFESEDVVFSHSRLLTGKVVGILVGNRPAVINIDPLRLRD